MESMLNLIGAELGRKNYYGTRSVWSGNLLAYSMSILQTAAKT